MLAAAAAIAAADIVGGPFSPVDTDTVTAGSDEADGPSVLADLAGDSPLKAEAPVSSRARGLRTADGMLPDIASGFVDT